MIKRIPPHTKTSVLNHTLTFLVALIVFSETGRAQTQSYQPGISAWIYHLYNSGNEQLVTSMPVLNGGNPNDYEVLSPGASTNSGQAFNGLSFVGGWTSPYASNPPVTDISYYFFGHLWGNIVLPSAGNYQFRLTSEDGSQFFINNTLVINNDHQGLNSASASFSGTSGSIPFYINYYSNAGTAQIKLEWMRPGETSWSVVPATSFETQQGQTLVTSASPPTWTYANGLGGTQGGPGDGQHLTSIHPSFTLENILPGGFQPEVGGMDFLSNGNLVISTWSSPSGNNYAAMGSVYVLGNLSGPGPITYKRFASGLGEPLGLKVVNDVVYVTQKREVTMLVDTDGDGIADEYQVVAQGWPMSFNYHEFNFNCCYKDGYFYLTESTPLRTGDTMYLPGTQPGYPVWNGPGSLIQVDPIAHTWKIASNGLRTPNGMNTCIDGELFCSDNQGDWLVDCKINHIVPGHFHGVPQFNTYPAGNNQTLPDGNVASYLPAAVIMPYNSVNGSTILSNSTTQPISIPSGTYAGQMLVGELTDGGLNRIYMEKVNGQYQGCVFGFAGSNTNNSIGFMSGINRMAWGPDGCLYVGGLGSGGNWNWNGTTYGLQRIRPNGNITFEPKSVQSRSNGFEIEFTQPAPTSILSNPANYTVLQWNQPYPPSSNYGGNQTNVTTLTPGTPVYSADRMHVFLPLSNMKSTATNGPAEWTTYFRLKNFTNDAGTPPWITEAWYTLNNISPIAGPTFSVAAPPPPPPPGATATATYEAETATFSPASLLSVPQGAGLFASVTGYTGTGFLQYQNATGDYTQWSVNAPDSAPYTIGFRYSLAGSATSNLTIAVDGATLVGSLAFAPTGGNSNWQVVTTNTFLTKGSHTIRATATGSGGPNMDHLELTGPGAPPMNAVMLYDGTLSSVSNWVRATDGSPANWNNASGGYLQVAHSPAPDDIVSTLHLKDFQLHVEFLSPPGGSGTSAGASGVMLQRRYGLQILNTPASIPASSLSLTDAGSITGFRHGDVNAATGPGMWQSLDVKFAAPRWLPSSSTKVYNANVTVYLNGTVIHNAVDVPASTNPAVPETPGMDGILLESLPESALGEVQFRNIWVIPSPDFTSMLNAWALGFGLKGGNTAPLATPMNDGFNNLWKYATGLNPSKSATIGQQTQFTPQQSFYTDTQNNKYLQFTYIRRTDYKAVGLYFTVETSPDFQTWTQVPSTEISATPNGDNFSETVLVRANSAVPSGAGSYFARVRVQVLQ